MYALNVLGGLSLRLDHLCSLLFGLIQNGLDGFLVLGGGLGAEVPLVLVML